MFHKPEQTKILVKKSIQHFSLENEISSQIEIFVSPIFSPLFSFSVFLETVDEKKK